ncbi:hypothetical protein LEN26_020728 [Aphanomyces euteiches]|nr:hypothetical protein LEN26_020728 [Aphanomyces euteiches]
MYQPIPSTDKAPSAPYAPPPPPQPQQQYQYQVPVYQAQPAYANATPYAVIYTQAPRRNAVQRYASKLCLAFALAVLNFVNMFFSIGLFLVVVIPMVLSFGLLPVACLGLIVLNILVCLVNPISALDGWFYRQRERIYDSLLDEN